MQTAGRPCLSVRVGGASPHASVVPGPCAATTIPPSDRTRTRQTCASSRAARAPTSSSRVQRAARASVCGCALMWRRLWFPRRRGGGAVRVRV
eukprot:6192855-Prymnesium_polylepis.2